ncbi:extracellular solute-binding protein [Amycolatopsis anabasis]|uniref:extracellular solute-binding protein n=1 Tax=Amycolatopsis anabasis TaxID=1840409 RepID=UPI00131B59CB|nr:extracellular solute-binding protein [Amycolatopsis anabasis]
MTGRRRWTKIAGAAVLAAALLAGCTGGAPNGRLTFVSYGKGAYQDGQQAAFLEPFEKRSGLKITVDGPSDNAKLRAMVEAGKVTWDVMDTDAFIAREQCGKLLEKIDVGALRDSFPPGTLSDCGVPTALFGLAFLYNEKTYGARPPTTLADFFDPAKFPGKRVIYAKDPAIGLYESALLADGVEPANLYPLDTGRALRAYDRIRPELILAQTYGQQQQAMVDNQADMALVVSARAYSVLKAGGLHWRAVQTKVPVTWDVLVVPKGSRNADHAKDLIRFASQPEQGAKFAELSGAGAANVRAEPALDDLRKRVDVLSKDRAGDQVLIDAQWWTENYQRMVREWAAWQSG